MNTLKPIIKGNLLSTKQALADLEKLPDAPRPIIPIISPTVTPSSSINLNGFYQIDKSRILNATTPAYRIFLRDSGYGDLDSCSSIGFAKGILRYDQNVRDASLRAGILITGNDGDYVVSINHSDARKLVEALGYKLPTTALMYKLFIPYIKELVQNGNLEAQATLNEMIGTKSEWLEDLILDKTRLKIGTQERIFSLPDKNGGFDRQDINEFGYPAKVSIAGEFYHWHVSGDERAVIRDWSSELDLNLNGEPSYANGDLGVRFTKFF